MRELAAENHATRSVDGWGDAQAVACAVIQGQASVHLVARLQLEVRGDASGAVEVASRADEDAFRKASRPGCLRMSVSVLDDAGKVGSTHVD